jgi:hypothetical protein
MRKKPVINLTPEGAPLVARLGSFGESHIVGDDYGVFARHWGYSFGKRATDFL